MLEFLIETVEWICNNSCGSTFIFPFAHSLDRDLVLVSVCLCSNNLEYEKKKLAPHVQISHLQQIAKSRHAIQIIINWFLCSRIGNILWICGQKPIKIVSFYYFLYNLSNMRRFIGLIRIANESIDQFSSVQFNSIRVCIHILIILSFWTYFKLRSCVRYSLLNKYWKYH